MERGAKAAVVVMAVAFTFIFLFASYFGLLAVNTNPAGVGQFVLEDMGSGLYKATFTGWAKSPPMSFNSVFYGISIVLHTAPYCLGCIPSPTNINLNPYTTILQESQMFTRLPQCGPDQVAGFAGMEKIDLGNGKYSYLIGTDMTFHVPSDPCSQSNPQASFGGYFILNDTSYNPCGNGIIDAGETCSSCPADVKCPGGTQCVSGVCQAVPLCPNGRVDAGENCLNCPQDVICPTGTQCISGVCQVIITCGNGAINIGETCTSCPQDVVCPLGEFCDSNTNQCVAEPGVCADKVRMCGGGCPPCPIDIPYWLIIPVASSLIIGVSIIGIWLYRRR